MKLKIKLKQYVVTNQLNRLKDFMKTKFESNDDLPLGKILSIPVCIITVGSVFQEDKNYYPQVYLHECLHEFEHKDENYSQPIV